MQSIYGCEDDVEENEVGECAGNEQSIQRGAVSHDLDAKVAEFLKRVCARRASFHDNFPEARGEDDIAPDVCRERGNGRENEDG